MSHFRHTLWFGAVVWVVTHVIHTSSACSTGCQVEESGTKASPTILSIIINFKRTSCYGRVEHPANNKVYGLEFNALN